MVKMNHFIVFEKRPRHITGMFVFKVIVKKMFHGYTIVNDG